MTNKLLNGANALNASGSVNTIRRFNKQGTFQVEITGTATVTLYGQSDSTAPLVAINTYTASGAEEVVVFPTMTAKITAFSSGTVNAWLNE